MPLRDPFALRIATIQAFMELPSFRLLELSRPPDLELLVRKVLARMADDPDDPHAYVYLAPGFDGYRAFFTAVAGAVAADVGRARVHMDDVEMEVPEPPELGETGSGEGVPKDDRDGPTRWPTRWAGQVADYLSAVGDALPDGAGSLVLVVEPDGSGDRRALGWSLGALAWYMRSDRAKLLVVDGGDDPLVSPDGGVEDRLVRLDFAVPPDELEKQVLSDLDSDTLGPAEARRYQLLAGAFATSAGRFDDAETRLRAALEETRGRGEPGEEANVLYNLGTLHIRREHFEEASETLTRAASAAFEGENNALAAMALTNLGVALHREGRGAEALESFGAAREIFRALDHRPGEAHVLDCTARSWAEADPERARALWREAAELYDSIEAPHLHEVRETGRDDALARIRRLESRPGDR